MKRNEKAKEEECESNDRLSDDVVELQLQCIWGVVVVSSSSSGVMVTCMISWTDSDVVSEAG